MTLESTINKNRYIGNGATTQFPFTFKVWKSDQILVFTGNGTTEQDVSTQCAIDLTDTGGTVTFPAAPAYGTVIVIRRSMPYIQEDDYRNGTRFDSEEIEDRFDQDCAERQDLRFDIGRAIKTPLTSSKTPYEFQHEFWDAYADSQVLHDEVAGLHADMVEEHGRIADERAEALEAIQDEGDHQVQRVESIASIIMADTGNACMEVNWTLAGNVPANTDVDIDPLWYVVGRHHLQVSVNGVRQYRTKHYNEKGADATHSHVFTTLVPLNAGDTVNVWICHLSGKNVSSAATHEQDGLMASEDKAKLDGIETGAQENVIETIQKNGVALAVQNHSVDISVPVLARATRVLTSTLAANTPMTVPEHAVGSGLLLVYHNGVLCEAGETAQYVDVSSTTIKFNYSIPAGDSITVSTAAVGAS